MRVEQYQCGQNITNYTRAAIVQRCNCSHRFEGYLFVICIKRFSFFSKYHTFILLKVWEVALFIRKDSPFHLKSVGSS